MLKLGLTFLIKKKINLSKKNTNYKNTNEFYMGNPTPN